MKVLAALPKRIYHALSLLWDAFEHAQQTGGDRWEYAVGIDRLSDLSVTPNDIRLLVRMKLVEHAREVTAEGRDRRKFLPTGDMTFVAASCFVVHPCAVHVVAKICQRSVLRPLIPTWDASSRELRLGVAIVKHFKRRAVNQELVLSAFQEEGWPPRIDDPLSPHGSQGPKRRLRDTIKCLNQKQPLKLIHFRGDGTGEGVLWCLAQSPNDDYLRPHETRMESAAV